MSSFVHFRVGPAPTLTPKLAYERERRALLSAHFDELRSALAAVGWPRIEMATQVDILVAAAQFVRWVQAQAQAQAQAAAEPAHESVPDQSPEVTACFARD